MFYIGIANILYTSTWKVFGIWCSRRTENIIWTDRARNEEMLHRVKDERNILHTAKKKKKLRV